MGGMVGWWDGPGGGCWFFVDEVAIGIFVFLSLVCHCEFGDGIGFC